MYWDGSADVNGNSFSRADVHWKVDSIDLGGSDWELVLGVQSLGNPYVIQGLFGSYVTKPNFIYPLRLTYRSQEVSTADLLGDPS